MVRAALVVLAVLVVAVAALTIFQRRLIYLPSGSVPPAAGVLASAREVTLTTSDGLRLGAWYVPAEPPDRGVTVLVANGNAGNRSLRAPLAEALAARGLSVLLFDYRGYGGNAGSPSEDGLARDAEAAYDYLVDDAGVPAGRIVYLGESLGAAVVTGLAAEHPPGGLVLRSPFVDLAAVARVHLPYLPVGTLLLDDYPVAEQVARVEVPTLVVYGTDDQTVPPEQSRQVAAAAAGPTSVVEVAGADHNDPALLNGPELVDAVVRLTDDLRRTGP